MVRRLPFQNNHGGGIVTGMGEREVQLFYAEGVGLSRAFPDRTSSGLPEGSERTATSRGPMPSAKPVPSALTAASLAANRAATWETARADGEAGSPGMALRSSSAMMRLRKCSPKRCSERSMRESSIRSSPMPMIAICAPSGSRLPSAGAEVKLTRCRRMVTRGRNDGTPFPNPVAPPPRPASRPYCFAKEHLCAYALSAPVTSVL